MFVAYMKKKILHYICCLPSHCDLRWWVWNVTIWWWFICVESYLMSITMDGLRSPQAIPMACCHEFHTGSVSLHDNLDGTFSFWHHLTTRVERLYGWLGWVILRVEQWSVFYWFHELRYDGLLHSLIRGWFLALIVAMHIWNLSRGWLLFMTMNTCVSTRMVIPYHIVFIILFI